MRLKQGIMGAFAAAGLLLGGAGAASAAVTKESFGLRNTRDLVDLCSASPRDPMGEAAVNFCHGFAQGSVSTAFRDAAIGRQPKPFCMPNPAPSRTETIDEFIRWVRANPDRMNENAASGLLAFFGERFPCPSGK